jgi:hypothetical protein
MGPGSTRWEGNGGVVIWPLVAITCMIWASYCAYRVGRSAGVDAERERCLDVCVAIAHDTKKLSPSLRRAQHAIMNGLEKPLSEAEFFGPKEAA